MKQVTMEEWYEFITNYKGQIELETKYSSALYEDEYYIQSDGPDPIKVLSILGRRYRN